MAGLDDSDIAIFDTEVSALRETHKFGHSTDFTINLGIFTWRCQIALLSKFSKFFERLRDGHFEESKKCTVELHDDDPWIFARFLQYVYTSQWNESASESTFYTPSFPTLWEIMIMGAQRVDLEETMLTENQRNWAEHLGALYLLADKYDVPHLKNCIAKLDVPCLSGEQIKPFIATVGEDLITREAQLKKSLSLLIAECYMYNTLNIDELLIKDAGLTSLVIEEAILLHGTYRSGDDGFDKEPYPPFALLKNLQSIILRASTGRGYYS